MTVARSASRKFAIAAMFLISGITMGQSEESPTALNSESPTDQPKPTKRRRLVNDFTLYPMAGIFGLHAFGASFSHQLTKSLDVTTLAQKTSGTGLVPASEAKRRSITSASTGLRYFVGKSFYGRGSFGYRMIKLTHPESFSSYGPLSPERTVNDDHTALEYAIGNHWKMDAVSITAEWIGGATAVFGSKIRFDNYTEHDEEQFELSDHNWTRDQIEFLKLGIGVVF